MRVAFISDIHANLIALEAALDALAGERVDRLVCLGDVAATGPQPREVLRRVRALGCALVMGNCDQMLLDWRAPDAPTGEPPGPLEALDRWCAEQLSADELAFVRTFQPTITIDLGAGRSLLCYHGSPRSFEERVEPFTTDAELADCFAGEHADVGAGGHTHNQMLRRFGDMLLLNPGTIGLPRYRLATDTQRRKPAWAEYAVLDCAGPRLSVELRRVPFDVEALRATMRASGMPYTEEFLAGWTPA